MSAQYENGSGLAYCPYGKVNEYDEALISVLFDQETDYDIEEMERLMQEERLMRKICFIKTLVFPIEYIATLAILGGRWAKEKRDAQSLYWKFLRKKVTYNQFQRELVRVIRNAPIGA